MTDISFATLLHCKCENVTNLPEKIHLNLISFPLRPGTGVGVAHINSGFAVSGMSTT